MECRCRCYYQLTENEKKEIFQNFNEMRDHEMQNTYLRGCITKKPDQKIRRRPRNADGQKRNSFTFTVTLEEKSVIACRAAFLGLHGIGIGRLKRKVLNFAVDIKDNRGKHGNHPKVDESTKNLIREHIQNFPARESHYSRSVNARRKYLDSSMNVAKMHRIFLIHYPELRTVCKYSLYHEIFNYEFNISFGFPRSDICDPCEKQQVAIKAAELHGNESAIKQRKAENELHLRKADVFNAQLREATESAKTMVTDCDTAVIAMDFQKNLPLPLTGICQEYYKRQLWIHNFCIHDCVNGNAMMFLYAEHYAGKGPNEVISCLDHYISTLPPTTKKVKIFADNCFSQNKNRYIVAYLHSMVHKNLEEIQLFYPLPGHSRLPCDRDFARIEKNRRRKDRVVKPSEWVNLIKETDLSNPFQTVFVEHPLTDDLKHDGTPVVKVKDYKRGLDAFLRPPSGIAAIRGLLFRRGQNPRCRYSMTGDCSTEICLLKRGKKLRELLGAFSKLLPAHLTFLGIKKAKFDDVVALLGHVTIPNEVTFCNTLSTQPEQQQESDDDEDVE